MKPKTFETVLCLHALSAVTTWSKFDSYEVIIFQRTVSLILHCVQVITNKEWLDVSAGRNIKCFVGQRSWMWYSEVQGRFPTGSAVPKFCRGQLKTVSRLVGALCTGCNWFDKERNEQLADLKEACFFLRFYCNTHWCLSSKLHIPFRNRVLNGAVGVCVRLRSCSLTFCTC